MSDNLMRIVDPDGEVIKAFTAQDLLAAAGIHEPKGAQLAELIAFMDGSEHLASITREARTIVGDDLVRRCDRLGKWTLHEGGFTIKTASPAAGTLAYDNTKLVENLRALVEQDTIDQEAMDAAIEFIQPPAPAPYWKQKAQGIKNLLKLGPVVCEAVVGAQVPLDPPRRTVKVSRSN